MQQDPGELCSVCNHPFDPHVMVTMFEEVERGGIVVCSPDCDCVATWSADGTRPDFGDPDRLRDIFWERMSTAQK